MDARSPLTSIIFYRILATAMNICQNMLWLALVANSGWWFGIWNIFFVFSYVNRD